MRYRRRPPTRGETARAAVISAALGAGIGLVSFYLTRLLLAREPLASGATASGSGGSTPTSSEDREG